MYHIIDVRACCPYLSSSETSIARPTAVLPRFPCRYVLVGSAQNRPRQMHPNPASTPAPEMPQHRRASEVNEAEAARFERLVLHHQSLQQSRKQNRTAGEFVSAPSTISHRRFHHQQNRRYAGAAHPFPRSCTFIRCPLIQESSAGVVQHFIHKVYLIRHRFCRFSTTPS